MEIPLDQIEELKKEITQTKLLVCGEIHGIQENYLVYRKLIDILAIDQVGIELTNSTFHFLLEPTSVQNLSDTLQQLHWEDGRINQKLIELLQYLSNNSIPVFFFDNGTEANYNENPSDKDLRDRIMAEEIKKNKLEEKLTLIWAGNYHTNTSRIKKSNKSMITFLSEMQIPFTNVTFKYGNGTFYNFGINKLSHKNAESTYRLYKENGKFVLYIPHATAVDVQDFT